MHPRRRSFPRRRCGLAATRLKRINRRALGYDAAYIVSDAISRAGSTNKSKIRDALATTKDFPGVTGVISIDKNRNAIKSAVVLKIVGNGAKYVTTVKP